MKKGLLVVVLCVVLTGCMKVQNPETGDTEIAFTPEAGEVVEKVGNVVEVVEDYIIPISALWPPARLIIPILGVLFGVLKAKKAYSYRSAASVAVRAVEKFKKENPTQWEEKIKPWLIKATPNEIKEVIAGIKDGIS